MIVANGGKVAILDLNEDLAKATAEEIGSASAYQVNVTDDASVSAAIEKIHADFGAIHINVNCAGIGAASRTVGRDGALDIAKFNFIIQVNLIGTFSVLSKCAAIMQVNEPEGEALERGVVVNTASVAGYEGQIGQVAYSATKGGVIGMTIVIARDLAELGIRCNTIVPGLIHTPMFDTLPENIFQALESSVLNPQRLGKPDEIAKTAQYLVENDYVNGECIRMDGGIRMTPR